MKFILFTCLSLFMVFSCGDSKKVIEEVADAASEGYTLGVVTDEYKEDGCSFLIAVNVDDEVVYYDPQGLPDEFKTNGLEIKMKYRVSRIVQETCFKGPPILLEEILKR